MTRPERGEVWWCEPPAIGRRPVVVLSRSAAIIGRGRVLVAPCTTTVRGLPSDVTPDPRTDPVPRPCVATLAAVAKAPPKRFAGGGQWEAMHGEMTRYFEARVTSKTPNGKWHYRLFCLRDYDGAGTTSPLLTVSDGAAKPYRTTLSGNRYAAVRALGDE